MGGDSKLETDYLVVGAGALGMAFVDALIEHSDADVVMVERRHRPGGHWLDAYPFVQLHQPSRFYGVNSTPLGQDRTEAEGTDTGFYERASGAEICGYFDEIMRHRFLASGRVRFFPMCDYLGDGRFRSATLLLGESRQHARGARDGRLEKTGQLRQQHFLGRNGGQGLHTFRVQCLAGVSACLDDQLVVALGKVGDDFGRGDGVFGKAVDQRADHALRGHFERGAGDGATGERVLQDMKVHTLVARLLAQQATSAHLPWRHIG